MKKRYIVITVILVVILGLGWLVYKGLGSLDQIIEAALEKYGSEITGTELTVDSVKLDLGSGSAALNGLSMGNPSGFNTDHALRLGQASIALDLDTITSDPVVIREIRIDAPDVIYEMASGGSNIDTIMDNVNRYLGTGGEQEKSADQSGGGKRLIIENVYVTGGKVSVSHAALQGRKLTTPMPDIHLQDIGKKSGGATPGEVAKEIFSSIRSGVTTGIAGLNLDQLPGAVADQLRSVTGMAGQGAGAVMDTAKSTGGKLSEGLGSAGSKLKGLLGGDDGE